MNTPAEKKCLRKLTKITLGIGSPLFAEENASKLKPKSVEIIAELKQKYEEILTYLNCEDAGDMLLAIMSEDFEDISLLDNGLALNMAEYTKLFKKLVESLGDIDPELAEEMSEYMEMTSVMLER